MLNRLSPYWLWALLALPPVLWTYQALTSTNERILHMLVHPTGEWAARLLIVTMMATPLMLLFKGWRGPRWLRKNRRYLGVAAFGYAALHTVFYLIDKGSLTRVLGELDRTYIWAGWVAFLIFVPLAVTSMDAAQKIMGCNAPPMWPPSSR
jgi:sulfoxide reductase heme-binding subunit YedZ